MIIADTSGLLAYFNRREPKHQAAVDSVSQAEGVVISPYVLAELDYLVATRRGVGDELAVLAELGSGAWHLADFGMRELEIAIDLISKYRDQEIGLADASLVVLASRYQTRRLLTLDRRHFEVVRPLTGGRFSLNP